LISHLHLVLRSREAELYLHSPICLHGIMLSQLNTETNVLSFTFLFEATFGIIRRPFPFRSLPVHHSIVILSRYSDRLRIGRPRNQGSIPNRGKKIFLLQAFIPALGPTQYPIPRARKPLSRGVKRLGREADHSPPSSTVIKNVWSITTTLLYVLIIFPLQCDAMQSEILRASLNKQQMKEINTRKRVQNGIHLCHDICLHKDFNGT
jgi:hypothetical protein